MTTMAVQAQSDARRAPAPRRLPDLRADVPRQAARVPRLGGELAEAASGARRDDASSTRRRTRTSTAASTSSASARPQGSRTRARRCARSSTRRSAREIIFVRNATEAINLVAYAWGLDEPRPRRRRARDRARAPLELRAVAVRRRAARAPSSGSSRSTTPASCVLDELDRFENVKVVAAGVVSNSLGTINDTPKLAAWAHERGAILVCDARAGGAARAARRAGARRRLRRRLGPQDAAARAGSASSGAAPSCCSRWSRSCSAAT